MLGHPPTVRLGRAGKAARPVSALALVAVFELAALGWGLAPAPAELLARQASLGSLAERASALAQAALGDAFGGVYVDAPAGRVHVAIAGGAPAGRLLAGSLGRWGVEVDRVPFSRRELLVARDRVMADRRMLALEGVTVVSAGPDYRADRMDVGVATPSSRAATILSRRYGPGLLRIHQARPRTRFWDGSPGPAASARAVTVPFATAGDGSELLLAGGTNIGLSMRGGGETCSIGFSVEDLTSKRDGLLTAAHCTDGATGAVRLANPLGQRPQVLGSIGEIGPDTLPKRPGASFIADAGLVLLDAAQTPSALLTDGRRQFSVVGAGDPVQGEVLCKIGVATGLTFGTVTETDKAEADGPSTIMGLAVFQGGPGQRVGDHGDSGGSVFRPLSGSCPATADQGGGAAAALAVGLVQGGGPTDDTNICEFSTLTRAFQAFRDQGVSLGLLVAAGQPPDGPAGVPNPPAASAPAPGPISPPGPSTTGQTVLPGPGGQPEDAPPGPSDPGRL